MMKAKFLLLISTLFLIFSCSDKTSDELIYPESDGATMVKFNRQFYQDGDMISVDFYSDFHKKIVEVGDRFADRSSSIIYGEDIEQIDGGFDIQESFVFDYYRIVSSHSKEDLVANHQVTEVSHRVSMPNLFPQDYQFDTIIKVFENKRIDFLMDKLAPRDLKSTYLEQVFIGEDKIKAPDHVLRDIPEVSPTSYRQLKEQNFNSFAGLYGETDIYGDNIIDSIVVRHGSFLSGLNLGAVAEDIVDTYGAVEVDSQDHHIELETEHLIFYTRNPKVGSEYSRNIITTVKRKE